MPDAQQSQKLSPTSQTRKQSPISVSASDIGARSSGMTLQSKCATKPASVSRKPLRAKTCKGCGDKFVPDRALQVVCSVPCSWAYVGKQNAATDRRLTRAAKAKLKTRRDWLREAQAAFNRFIRARDVGKPCISCGRHHQGQIHAGHFLSTGARPELRFNENNVHAQCAPCNNHLSGNIVLYRKGLIAKVGIELVEWLEGPHQPKKYTIDELKSIKDKYTKLAKELA